MLTLPTARDYGEVSLNSHRPVRLQPQEGVQQIPNRPDAIRNTKRDAGRGPQSLMDAAEVVVGDVQADGGGVVGELL